MEIYSRYKKTRIALLFWCFFIGIGALVGSMMMFLDPDEAFFMKDLLPSFQVLPFADKLFQNFIFPGISLFIVNCITNISAGILLLYNKKLGIILGGIFGITLMMWITIQFIIFPLNFMSTIYFIFGFIQAITGYMTYVFYKQESFAFNEQDYPNIDMKNKDILVVYFSRMGFTKKIAYEEANKLKASIYEIKSTEKTEHTLGFWWCGRYGMHGWEMPIEKIKINIEDYKKVIIVSPIWVFKICGPIREFCIQYKEKINEVSYIVVHHMNKSFLSANQEMNLILGKTSKEFTSVCCKMGVYKKKECFNFLEKKI